MIAASHFSSFFFRKGLKRAFPTDLGAIKVSTEQPTRHSYLGEPVHDGMGFMCQLNTKIMSQTQLFLSLYSNRRFGHLDIKIHPENSTNIPYMLTGVISRALVRWAVLGGSTP